MDARDLEYFAVVAEHGNLHRAADALNLSQPALSMSLRRLERSAGTKLVNRTPKGVELTAVGTALLAHARRLRQTFDEIAREISDLSKGLAGHVRLGSSPIKIDPLVSPACTRLLKEAEKVTAHITIGSNDVLLPALRRGELDVVICGSPAAVHDDLVHEQVANERFVIYASADHRLARRKQVAMRDLAKERWVLTSRGTNAHKTLSRLFEEEGLAPPAIVMESAYIVPKMRLVASTDVLGFTPWEDVAEAAGRLQLVMLRVPGLSAMRSTGMCYRKDAYLPPAAKRFVEILRATAKESDSKQE
jgi:DNA-binding transcriptional LysR family regulator